MKTKRKPSRIKWPKHPYFTCPSNRLHALAHVIIKAEKRFEKSVKKNFPVGAEVIVQSMTKADPLTDVGLHAKIVAHSLSLSEGAVVSFRDEPNRTTHSIFGFRVRDIDDKPAWMISWAFVYTPADYELRVGALRGDRVTASATPKRRPKR